MARLTWNNTTQRRFETGVDHGVLYPQTGPGVVWNGLVGVEDDASGGEVNSFYFDGIKYVDLVSPKNFQATLTAFSAPAEFSPANGEIPVIPGFLITRQPRQKFGLSYRTKMGDNGYKIHIVYNATATMSERSYVTLSDQIEATQLSWVIDATPPSSSIYRPSAHFVVDSTKVSSDALLALENVLYGTGLTQPALPSVDDLVLMIALSRPLLVIANRITGLSILAPGVGDLSKTAVVGIYRSLPTTKLIETATSGLYRLE